MPTQEVARAARPVTLLRGGGAGLRPFLLDGGGLDSWADGRLLFAADPRAALEVYASGWGRWRLGGSEYWRRGDPLVQWQEFLDGAAAHLPQGADHGGAGVLTVLAYDLKHWIERLPRRHRWPDHPLLYSALYDWHYTASYHSGRAWISAACQGDLEARLRWYERSWRPPAAARDGFPDTAYPRPTLGEADYRRMIERAQNYIAAGDIYQVNLAQGFTAPFPQACGAALFARWVERFPMPFGAYVDGGDWVAVSNSPECYLLVDEDRVATFPIKGTRRIAPGEVAVAPLAEQLSNDPKESAEHVMIVDLERNDLGRVCEPGTVEVAEFAAVHQYPVLLHMVSEVRGRPRPHTSLSTVVRATFPGGSITGAPKVRAMEIIEELEPGARGFYTGAIGWTELSGHSRFSLAIRTAVLTDAELVYHAGGGIVADSDAQREYEESLLKAETLFRALSSLVKAS